MPYLVSQMLLCLLVAAALGAAVGWLVKGVLAARKERGSEEEWRRRLRQSEARAGTFKNQLTEAQLTEEKLRTELRELRRVRAGAGALGDAETIEALQAELVRRDKKIDVLKLEVSQSKAALTSEWESLKTLKTELAERHSRLDARAKRQGEERRKLQEQLDVLTRRYARLKSELAGRRQRSAAGKAKRQAEIEKPGRTERPAERPKKAAAPPAEKAERARRDDLERIRGIGPVLARKLDEIGVVSFRQLASWTDGDVARAAEKLGISAGRIRPWIQAAEELRRAQGSQSSS